MAAFYMPVLLLLALIFRGVAFEFRARGRLLGAGRLVLKSEDAQLRDWARDRIPLLATSVVEILVFAAVTAFVDRARMTGSLFIDRPWGLVLPLIGLIAIVDIFGGAHRRLDSWPFMMTVLLFVAAFLSLATMFWPYMIPYSVTVASAAAPFLFWGAGLFVLPVIGLYTFVIYWMFRGRQRAGYGATSGAPSSAKREPKVQHREAGCACCARRYACRARK